MKAILNIAGFLLYAVVWFFIGWFAYQCSQPARHYPDPFKTVTKQMKSIQQQVGCKEIDAVIGPETTRLVNAKVKQEERELCNKYAIEAMERMAKGKE